MGGAIPIYFGWFDEIDEKIFNKNRILFYDPCDNDSIENIKNKIIYFLNNEDDFINFYKQDLFCDTAYDVIQKLENNFMNKIFNKHILINKLFQIIILIFLYIKNIIYKHNEKYSEIDSLSKC